MCQMEHCLGYFLWLFAVFDVLILYPLAYPVLGDTHTQWKWLTFFWSLRKSPHKQKAVIFLGLKLARVFLVIHFRFSLTQADLCVISTFWWCDDWQPSSRERPLLAVYFGLFIGFCLWGSSTFFPLYISKKPELLKRLLFPSLLEREREMSRGRRRRRLSFMTSSFLVFSCLLVSCLLLSSSWSSIISAAAKKSSHCLSLLQRKKERKWGLQFTQSY